MLTLTRRQLLRGAAAGAAALVVAPLTALAADEKPTGFTLPKLPYAYDALEPTIDEVTMKIHHDLHHKAYVDNLNKALAGQEEWQGKSIEEILRNLNKLPEKIRTAVQNNGGGHANHRMFWEIMGKESGKPSGGLAKAIEKTFGDLATLQKVMNAAGLSQFGSGWTWLVLANGELQVRSSANQDSPLMSGQVPIIGIDVWEHAYYLKYRNRRAEYLTAWWKVINWENVSERYAKATKDA